MCLELVWAHPLDLECRTCNHLEKLGSIEPRNETDPAFQQLLAQNCGLDIY